MGDIKQKYTLLGPAMDDAARLQQFCRPGQTVIGPQTQALVAEHSVDYVCAKQIGREEEQAYCFYDV